MENAAHTLSGLVIARLGADRHGPWATALLVTAANFPDVDCVSAFLGLPTYLRWHHGVTHSILGLAVAGPLLGMLFHRIATRRGYVVRTSTFIGLAYVGLLMHGALDALLSYGMRPFLPFDAKWYYGDVIFVADPWVWIILGAGTVLGGPRRGGGVWSWAVFASATVAVSALAFQAGRTPLNAAFGLAPAWLLLIGLRMAGIGEGSRRRFAALSLAVFGSYVAILALCSRVNHARGVQAIERSPAARGSIDPGSNHVSSCSARPCIPWQHRVVVQTRDSVFSAVVDALSGRVVLEARVDSNQNDPRLAAFRDTEVHRAWRTFARHPVAAWRVDRWILGDARYPDGWCDLEIVVE